MAHDEVYGFCTNKCKVPVAPKTETDAFDSRISALENTIPEEGVVKGFLFVTGAVTTEETDVLYASCDAIEWTATNSSNSFVVDFYPLEHPFPIKHCEGVYTRREDLRGDFPPTNITTRKCTIQNINNYKAHNVSYSLSSGGSGSKTLDCWESMTINVPCGNTLTVSASGNGQIKLTIPAGGVPYYIKYDTP